MRRFLALVLTTVCLYCLPADALEVRTVPPPRKPSADRVHYPDFAKHFSDTVRAHPPVSDCQVQLIATDANGILNRVEIAIQLDREALITHLQQVRNLHFVTVKEQERYIHSFQSSMKRAAVDIFADIEQNSIIISVVVK